MFLKASVYNLICVPEQNDDCFLCNLHTNGGEYNWIGRMCTFVTARFKRIGFGTQSAHTVVTGLFFGLNIIIVGSHSG